MAAMRQLPLPQQCNGPRHLPVPNMLDFATRAAGCTYFSKIDLKKGYHQVPMNATGIPKTAITTPHRPHPQRPGERLPCLDDILVFSKTKEDHRRHLQETYICLRAAHPTANAEKCEFGKTSIKFLGHNVSASGIAPLPSRVAAITPHPQPNTIKKLQNFLGLINFYRQFVPWPAAMLRPLTDAHRGSSRPKTAVEWTAERRTAFKATRSALGSITEAMWPLGCSIRWNVSLVLLSTSRLVATDTDGRFARRKSTPILGKVTSALRKVHIKRQPLSCSWSRSSPQQRIGWPPGPIRRSCRVWGSLDLWGRKLNVTPAPCQLGKANPLAGTVPGPASRWPGR